MMFHDRTYAAFLLADALKSYKNTNSIVLAVPRGGVPIGYQLARLLNLPLDLVMCKKIGHPNNPEYAIGAVSLEDVYVDAAAHSVSSDYIQSTARQLQNKMEDQLKALSPLSTRLECTGKNVIITDDGIATGHTLQACIDSIRKKKPSKIIIATPIASKSAMGRLMPLVDDIICLSTPKDFYAIGQFYEYFPQVSDEEVKKLLMKSTGEEVEPVV
jgi:putative phosphoribosyl transferase